MLTYTDQSIQFTNGNETVRIDAWGQGLRIRSVPFGKIPDEPWALEEIPAKDVRITLPTEENAAVSIENGGIKCTVTGAHLSFSKDGALLFEEIIPHSISYPRTREYRPIIGTSSFEATLRFRAFDGEKIHGMGQYLDGKYDLKGCTLELAQRNAQISIPFFISNRGYGFLWNHPGIGQVDFADNKTEWHARSMEKMDYWVCCGDTPKEIIEKYTEVTGRATELPASLLGLWQCKLRYRTQEELLETAREYHRRGIQLDVIVIDFFHWIYQGDWDFDPDYWPDPKAMMEELKSYGIRLMVSVWPTVDARSKNYEDFSKNGYLVSSDRGFPSMFRFFGYQHFFDPTNPDGRKFAAELLQKNYGQYGIDLFWLDVAEPQYTVPDRDIQRYYLGSGLQVANFYPRAYSQAVYEGLKAQGKKDILNLVRCAWVGSPKYGALVWSGDIESSFSQMKRQIFNGINMGVAGIPYWISDIGGFFGGNIHDPVFKELIVRWYQWAVFTPILRMHGDRNPHDIPALTRDTERGGGFCGTGAPNELWSYGEDNYRIFLKYLQIREELKPYISSIAQTAQETGTPLIRAMFLEFPEDENAWDLADQYMFGPDYLVAPITEYAARERRVYLPKGKWQPMDGSSPIDSAGAFHVVSAPLDYMPVFKRMDK